MIFNIQELLSDAQAITASAVSTNTIDLGATGKVLGGTVNLKRDIGPGEEIPFRVQFVENFNNITSIQIDLQVAIDVAFTTPKTVQSVVVPLAGAVAGRVLRYDYVPAGTDMRYARMNYTLVGTAPTTGKVTAGPVFDHQEGSL